MDTPFVLKTVLSLRLITYVSFGWVVMALK